MLRAAADNLLFFTDRGQVYKAKACDFEDTKASVLGDFVPAKLGMDEGESAIAMAVTADYQGYMLFCFENGKVAKVNLNAYETKTNRKKLLKAYSTREKLTAALCLHEDGQIFADCLQRTSVAGCRPPCCLPKRPRTSRDFR